MDEWFGDKSLRYADKYIEKLEDDLKALQESYKELLEEYHYLLKTGLAKEEKIELPEKAIAPIPGKMTTSQRRRVAQELFNKETLEKIQRFREAGTVNDPSNS